MRLKEGWYRPVEKWDLKRKLNNFHINSNARYHRFHNGKSICGKYEFENYFECCDEITDKTVNDKNNKICRICYRKFLKGKQKEKVLDRSYLINNSVCKNKYNLKLISQLIDEYNISITEMAAILKASKQFLYNLAKRNNLENDNFNNKEGTVGKQIKNIISTMNKNDKDTYYNNEKDIYIKIFQKRNNTKKRVAIYKIKDVIRVYYFK
ncbi:hypothetical protein [uncultured Clostridium sp.]|uniref:hypothetical protein n=1 Tax=uncultured Clostridium sp. TaxID=59620 RepID=UPI0027DDAD4B|nr:hypothetical protein [uncultured Clostridium sp.]